MRVHVLLLCLVAACHNNSGMRASPDEGWSYVTQTAEELEERARRLSQCLVAEPDTSQWIRHTTHIEVRLSLPPQYQSAMAVAAEQQSWDDNGGSTFLLTRHAGDGGARTMIFFGEKPTRVAER